MVFTTRGSLDKAKGDDKRVGGYLHPKKKEYCAFIKRVIEAGEQILERNL